jgi:hypothetical protein
VVDRLTTLSDTQELNYVVYAPYLPLAERVTVGEWELIPRQSLALADSVDARAHELALGLADLYELPGGAGGPVGAFARRRTGRVGDDPIDAAPMLDLHRALVVAVVDVNESPLVPEANRDPNAGHRALTSDNAVVHTSGITREGGWTATLTGGRIKLLAGGIQVLRQSDDPLPQVKIPPPSDLRLPFFRSDIDTEYADAAAESIAPDTDEARRLARAIDWLDLAWRNTTSLIDDLRVPALRAGFEVLLDPDEPDPDERIDAVRIGVYLGDLLTPEEPRTRRSWPNLRGGGETSRELTDLAWWCVRFSFLRNALMHGGAPSEEDWQHDGVHHVNLAEWWLRQAIKETIARDGHPYVRLGVLDRDLMRAYREAFAKRGIPFDDEAWQARG